jgi:hypothetical protein
MLVYFLENSKTRGSPLPLNETTSRSVYLIFGKWIIQTMVPIIVDI